MLVSWRESLNLCLLLRSETLRFRSIVLFNSVAEQRTFCSSKHNMPSSDITVSVTENSSQNVKLRFAKLTENAVQPTRGSTLAAGFDLHRLVNTRQFEGHAEACITRKPAGYLMVWRLRARLQGDSSLVRRIICPKRIGLG